MRKVWVLLVMVMAGAALIVTGCGKSDSQPLTKVSLSEVTHSIFYAPQYVALNLGFLRRKVLPSNCPTGRELTR